MCTVLDCALSHLKFVWMNKSLILFELLIENLHIDVITCLQTEELEIVDLSQQLDVFKVLAWVAR